MIDAKHLEALAAVSHRSFATGRPRPVPDPNPPYPAHPPAGRTHRPHARGALGSGPTHAGGHGRCAITANWPILERSLFEELSPDESGGFET